MEIVFFIALAILGVVAGIINTLAGGGSNLTIPALMVMGLPPEVANATNRIGVLFQTMTGSYSFYQKGHLPETDFKPIALLTMVGGVIGALIAAFLPRDILKFVLLGVMIGVSILMIVMPESIVRSDGSKPRRLKESQLAPYVLFFAGIYGGFIQAGVGFVLMVALGGLLAYDYKQATALRLVTTLLFTIVSVVIFILNDQVMWVPALVLSIGTIIGARIGVRFATQLKTRTLKWVVLFMTLFACLAALLK